MIQNLSTILVKICPNGRLGISPNDHLKITNAILAGHKIIVSNKVQAFLKQNWAEAHRCIVEPWSCTLAWTAFHKSE